MQRGYVIEILLIKIRNYILEVLKAMEYLEIICPARELALRQHYQCKQAPDVRPDAKPVTE
jgi:hypothetical protein